MIMRGMCARCIKLAILDHIENLLQQIDIKYTREESSILMRWQTDHFEDLKVRIIPNDDESWLYIYAPFTSINEIPEPKKTKFLYDMLKESWKANGVKFAVDQDDDIAIIAETNDTDITAEEIRTLIGHVVHACDVLWEIYPE